MTVYKFASSFWYTQGGKRRRNIKYIVEVHLRPKGTNESSSNKGLPHIRHSVYIRGAGISTIDSSSLGSSPATNTAPGTDPMQYPEAVVVDEVACNPTAVYDQVVLVAKYHPHRLREFIFTAANLVGAKFCQHSEEPRPLSDELTLQEKQVGARAHPGLCGYFHAGAIAGVETEDVEMRGETTGNRFRNQVRTHMYIIVYTSVFCNFCVTA